MITAIPIPLMVLILVISCEQENDLLINDVQMRAPVSETSRLNDALPLLKATLDHYAYEAYAGMYGVELTPENSQLIDKATLYAWVQANEQHKHPEVNLKNRAAIAALEEVHALLIQAPAGAPFRQSVYIYGPVSSLIITDVISLSGWKCVKEGIGFYGRGVLDPWGEIACGCVEEYKIITDDGPYSKCGKCPDEEDLQYPSVDIEPPVL